MLADVIEVQVILVAQMLDPLDAADDAGAVAPCAMLQMLGAHADGRGPAAAPASGKQRRAEGG